jgi:hypothetical protein
MCKRIPIAVLLAALIALVAGPASAQEPEHRIAPGEEPEVRIIEKPDKTIEEYSTNGRVYMIKVNPDMGPSYYLIDRDGDGEWDDRQDDLGRDFVVPQWIIFEW